MVDAVDRFLAREDEIPVETPLAASPEDAVDRFLSREQSSSFSELGKQETDPRASMMGGAIRGAVDLFERGVEAFRGEGAEDLPEIRGRLEQLKEREIQDIEARTEAPNQIDAMNPFTPHQFPPDQDRNTLMQDLRVRYRDAIVSMSATLGEDSGLNQPISKMMPKGTRFENRADGSVVVIEPDGKRWYVNKPGVSAEDFSKLAFHALVQAIPFPKLPGFLTSIGLKGTVGATLREVAKEATADQAALATGATDSADLDELLVGAVASFGLESISRLGNGLNRWRQRGAGRLPKDVVKLAEDMGIDLDSMDAATRLSLERRIQHIADQPAALRVAEAESVGVDLLESQAVQGQRGELLAGRESEIPSRIRQREAQVQVLRDAAEARGTELGTSGAASPVEAAASVQEGLGAAAARKRAAFQPAFEELKDFGPGQGPSAPVNTMVAAQREIRNRLTSERILENLDDFPAVKKSFLRAEQLMRRGEVTGRVALADVRAVRKELNARVNNLGLGKTTEKNAIIHDIIKPLRDWETKTLKDNMFDGDIEFIKRLRKAGVLRREYGEDFKEDVFIKDLTAKNPEGTREFIKAPEQILNYIFATSSLFGSGSKATLRNIKKLKRLLPAEEFQNLVQAANDKLFLPAMTGKGFSGSKLKEQLRLIKRDHGPVYREIFTETERKFHERMARVGEFVEFGKNARLPKNRRMAGIINRLTAAAGLATRNPLIRGIGRSNIPGEVVNVALGARGAPLRRRLQPRAPGTVFAGQQTAAALDEDDRVPIIAAAAGPFGP